MPKLNCHHFEQNRCNSCQWLHKSYAEQLAEKTADLKRLVSPYLLQSTEFLPAVTSPLAHFRNKAKMVVTGSVERPILGILNEDGTGTDLTDCPLYPQAFTPLFPILKNFIGRAGLVPYNVAKNGANSNIS